MDNTKKEIDESLIVISVYDSTLDSILLYKYDSYIKGILEDIVIGGDSANIVFSKKNKYYISNRLTKYDNKKIPHRSENYWIATGSLKQCNEDHFKRFVNKKIFLKNLGE